MPPHQILTDSQEQLQKKRSSIVPSGHGGFKNSPRSQGQAGCQPHTVTLASEGTTEMACRGPGLGLHSEKGFTFTTLSQVCRGLAVLGKGNHLALEKRKQLPLSLCLVRGGQGEDRPGGCAGMGLATQAGARGSGLRRFLKGMRGQTRLATSKAPTSPGVGWEGTIWEDRPPAPPGLSPL